MVALGTTEYHWILVLVPLAHGTAAGQIQKNQQKVEHCAMDHRPLVTKNEFELASNMIFVTKFLHFFR